MLNDKEKQRLEDYLSEIELFLKNVSVSDRSDIILELNSHIKESLSKGDQTLDQILNALGDPALVANRYLLAKGIQPMAPPRKFKWLKTLGLGTAFILSLFFFSLIMLFKSISPILSVDEENGRVIILGGLIDVNEEEGKVTLGKGLIKIKDDDTNIELSSYNETLDGAIPVTNSSTIEVKGQNGNWQFKHNENNELTYKCKLKGIGKNLNKEQLITYPQKNKIQFDFGDNILTGTKCRFSIPKNIKLHAKLGNGKIKMKELQQDIQAQINNGKIDFKRSKDVSYKFHTDVTSGEVKGLDLNSTPKNTDSEGYTVDLKVINGKIKVK